MPTNNVLKAAGLKSIPVLGNGHCLYSAVSFYLGTNPIQLRNKVADYLEKNAHAQEFIDFGLLSQGQNLEAYLHALRNSNEWASHIEIEVLMRVLKRSILVVMPDNQIVKASELNRFSNSEPIFVAYNGFNHYDGLVLKSNATAQSVLASLAAQIPASQTPVAKNNFEIETYFSQDKEHAKNAKYAAEINTLVEQCLHKLEKTETMINAQFAKNGLKETQKDNLITSIEKLRTQVIERGMNDYDKLTTLSSANEKGNFINVLKTEVEKFIKQVDNEFKPSTAHDRNTLFNRTSTHTIQNRGINSEQNRPFTPVLG